MIVFGVFLLAGVASAADADLLQPASDITYNENVDINGSLNVDSLRVGTAGSGGVTFFNGTVLNEGADPFTVGDDMRVDGEIWRTEKGGANPIKISDHVIPTLNNSNDFGDSSHRWKNIYAKDGDFSEGVLVGGGYGNSGVTISSTGSLYVDDSSTFKYNVEVKQGLSVTKSVNVGTFLAVQGDIKQNSDSYGSVKAMVMCNASSDGEIKERGPSNIECDWVGTGVYTVDFGFDISDNFYQATPFAFGDKVANFAVGSDNEKIDVWIKDIDGTPAPANASFMLTVY